MTSPRGRAHLGRAVLLALLLLGPALVVGASGAQAAACVEPTIQVDPIGGPPGTQVTVSGRGFFEDCYDPSAPGQAYTRPRPDSGIRLFFVENGQGKALAQIDAAEDGSFRTTVTVPAEAQGGFAQIAAAGSNGTPTQTFAVGEVVAPTPPAPAPPATAPGPIVAPAPPPAPTSVPGQTATTAAGAASAPGRARGGSTTTSPATATTEISGFDLTTSTLFPPANSTVPITPATASTTQPPALALSAPARGSSRLGVVLTLVLLPGIVAAGYLLYQRRFSGWPRRY